MHHNYVFYCNIRRCKTFSLPVKIDCDSIKVLIDLKGETFVKYLEYIYILSSYN